jgi:hypothetical protein
MLPVRNNLAFGISTARREFVHGEKMPLHIWVDNTGDASVGVWSCIELDLFKTRGFDIYDAHGHRVLDRNEVKFYEECKTSPELAELGDQFRTCFGNAPIPIPAHACVNGNDFDFTIDLADRFDLPPGEYTARLREDWMTYHRVCAPHDEPAFQEKRGDLRFAVVQP